MGTGLLALHSISSAPNWLLSEGVALAAVALIGYLFGRRTKDPGDDSPCDGHLEAELIRAAGIAESLRRDADQIRCEAAAHRIRIESFEAELRRLQSCGGEGAWQRLGNASEALLAPSLRLATALSQSCEHMQTHAARLMTLAGSRIDGPTGLHNRRALQEQLEVLLSATSSEERGFSIVLLSFASDPEGIDQQALTTLGQMLKADVRETDFVARYSNDELAVVMPKTPLAGALIFCQRIFPQAEELLGRNIWGGAVESQPEDYPYRLLSRADSALYSARTCEETCLFHHTGVMLKRHQPEPRQDDQQTIELRLTDLDPPLGGGGGAERGERRQNEVKVDASAPVDVH